jgi:hypothetical protein
MGNRIENELCVGCGNPLLFPFNEYRMCRICTEKVKKVLYETKMKHISKDKHKGVLDARRDRIFTATRPLGTDA